MGRRAAALPARVHSCACRELSSLPLQGVFYPGLPLMELAAPAAYRCNSIAQQALAKPTCARSIASFSLPPTPADANSIAQQALANVRTVYAFNGAERTVEAYAATLDTPMKVGGCAGCEHALFCCGWD